MINDYSYSFDTDLKYCYPNSDFTARANGFYRIYWA